MPGSTPVSYSTDSVYAAVPDFIQQQDAENGYPLWYFLYGVGQTIDRINVLTRYNMGPGMMVTANFGPWGDLNISDAQLAYALSPSDTTMTIFGTDETWYLIDTSEPFYLVLGELGSDEYGTEQIEVPAGNYNWLAPYVTFTGITRGANGTTPAYYPASAGADGTTYIADYADAPGWSQVLDINRCPDYALPWLGQFVGAQIASNSGQTRLQMTQKIKERAGFERGTLPAIVAELVTITNEQITSGTEPLTAQEVIALENTQPLPTSPITYGYNQYALTLLVPSRFFATYTYQSLQTAAGGSTATYTAVDSFITSLGGLYASLEGSTTPESNSPYVNFVYRYRPAGMQIFVGGY